MINAQEQKGVERMVFMNMHTGDARVLYATLSLVSQNKDFPDRNRKLHHVSTRQSHLATLVARSIHRFLGSAVLEKQHVASGRHESLLDRLRQPLENRRPAA